MKDQFSIIPPPDLVQKWWDNIPGTFTHLEDETQLAIQAATWGANQELKAGIEWWSIQLNCTDQEHLLPYFREARRPKPPNLRQQACDALDTYVYGNPDQDDKVRTYNIIRQALETLSND